MALGFPVQLGHSVVPLSGPWRFHLGDDQHWAAAGFDDSSWETVDLTAPPGAHDPDVGLTGYVPGWSSRGHSLYDGYAWYRLPVDLGGDLASGVAIAGPTDADDAYQIFFDGKLLGGSGDFSSPVPVATSVEPSQYLLPPSASLAGHHVIALRVWMDKMDAAPSESGGIHVAPSLGTPDGIRALYQIEWLQTVKGYIVDAVEPALLGVLALMALAPARRDRAYRWLIAALILTALVRVNQVTLFWTQRESLHGYDLARNVILTPLALAAWAVTWQSWLRHRLSRFVIMLSSVLCAAYMLAQLGSRTWFAPAWPIWLKAGLDHAAGGIRLIFAALIVDALICGGLNAKTARSHGLALVALILSCIGLFADELSRLGVPGIWFPGGVGVSRTQFAYAALIIVFFAHLLDRPDRPEVPA